MKETVLLVGYLAIGFFNGTLFVFGPAFDNDSFTPRIMAVILAVLEVLALRFVCNLIW